MAVLMAFRISPSSALFATNTSMRADVSPMAGGAGGAAGAATPAVTSSARLMLSKSPFFSVNSLYVASITNCGLLVGCQLYLEPSSNMMLKYGLPLVLPTFGTMPTTLQVFSIYLISCLQHSQIFGIRSRKQV